MAGYSQGVKNGVYITKKLMSALNLKDYQAVGFPGCWMCESTCDPTSYNKSEKAGSFKGSSANGSGYGAGLALWSNGWKNTILKKFNRYTPIETWSMDLQLEIVIKLCTLTYLNMLRNCSNAAESTDIVLRGYENGSGGTSTKLRSKESMKAYTWCKKSYIPDTGYQTFSDGYVGALTARTAWSRKILLSLGNYSAADLANVGSITGSGDYSFSDSGGGGGGAPPTPEEILKMIEQYKNQYPVHSEYETYTGSGGNIFSNSSTNAFSTAVLAQDKESKSSSYFKSNNKTHTRIYSTNDSTIILDELKLPVDTDDTWANKGVTEEDVKRWQAEQDKQKEEAKKKQEEEKKKAEEEAKKKEEETKKQNAENSSNSSTNTNSSTGNNSSTNKSKK